MILAAIQDINFWLYTSLYIIYFITVISTIVVILSENRNPVKVSHGLWYYSSCR